MKFGFLSLRYVLLFFDFAIITEQSCEFIELEVKGYPQLSEPLYLYLLQHPNIEFLAPNTACWRGYVGTWKIADGKLYLIGLLGYLSGYKEVDLNYLFPGETEVFAEWYSGELYISKGNDPAPSRFVTEISKNYTVLKVDKGCIVAN